MSWSVDPASNDCDNGNNNPDWSIPKKISLPLPQGLFVPQWWATRSLILLCYWTKTPAGYIRVFQIWVDAVPLISNDKQSIHVNTCSCPEMLWQLDSRYCLPWNQLRKRNGMLRIANWTVLRLLVAEKWIFLRSRILFITASTTLQLLQASWGIFVCCGWAE